MLSTRTLLRRTIGWRRCWLSTSAADETNALNEQGDAQAVQEVVRFRPQEPATLPVILDSKEHVVGYLSKILNARVYDAAIETELQHAKNLSTVRGKYFLLQC